MAERDHSPTLSLGDDEPGPGGLELEDASERYQLGEELGRGGMAVVHAATDRMLGRQVALKLLPEGRAAGEARLVREARALAQLRHDNVVAVYDVGRLGGRLFLAMEMVPGQTLREWLRTPRDWQAIVAIYRAAGRGLAAAHQVGIVHRDFKPDNVLVDEDGAVHVADFGLARWGDHVEPEERPPSAPALEAVTRDDVIVGTPGYMAPELLEGAAPDPLSDQWAFAAALYEAFRGRPPESARPEDDDDVDAKPEPERVRTPAWLERLIARALGPREGRFASMDALLAALERRPARRWRLALVLAALTLAVIAAVVLIRRRDRASAGAAEVSAAQLPELMASADRAASAGDWKQASMVLSRALTVTPRRGADDPALVPLFQSLERATRNANQPEYAALFQAAWSTSDPRERQIAALRALALAQTRVKAHARSVAPLEEALVLAETAPTSPMLPEVRLELGRGLWKGQGDRIRGRALIQAAHDELLRTRPPDDATLKLARDWLQRKRKER